MRSGGLFHRNSSVYSTACHCQQQQQQNPSKLHDYSRHYSDVIMGAMASQITCLTIVYSTVYSCADQRKHQSSASLGLCAGNSPVTGEFPAQMASNAQNFSIWWRHHALWMGDPPVNWTYVYVNHRWLVNSPHRGGSITESIPMWWRHYTYEGIGSPSYLRGWRFHVSLGPLLLTCINFNPSMGI